MSDLIDRQSVLNTFDYWVKSPMIGYTNGLVRLREMFEELPPVIPAEKISSSEKPNKWIPVSERLPKPYTWVYATCKSLVDDRENWVIDTCYVPNKEIAQEYKISDWGNVPILNMGDAEVIAWMKWIIPKPYKEG